jgi:collagen triple helix repeat protein
MGKGLGRFLRQNTIGLLALFIALGGTTYAASASLIGRNTVASPQVVNGSLQTKDLSAKARKALKGNRGPRGFAGAAGAAGAKGATGAQGIQGVKGDPGATTVTVVQGPTVTIAAGLKAFASADCPAGSVATGGGGVNVNTSGVHLLQSFANTGASPTAWTVSYENTSGASVDVHARVVCASP